jgi:hypothetical protein
VNRDEIDVVSSSWRRARSDPDLLLAALVERLPDTLPFRHVRAQWIVDAVTRLAPALGRPATFVPLAGDLLEARMPLTMDDLAVERDALFGALAAVGEPMTAGDQRRSWEMAIELFAEIVTSVCLDPFGTLTTPTCGGPVAPRCTP